jgi:predicted DNA-binding transcriptional regulator YafY
VNRVDRLFAILLELGNRRIHTAGELSGHFGLTQRTLYRDIAALKEMGIPIRGEAGTGYILEDGYMAPTLSLGAEEARIFALGIRYVETQSRGRSAEIARTLLKKLDLVLSSKARVEVQKWHDLVDLFMPLHSQDIDDPNLHRVLDAIHRGRVLEIQYRSWRNDKAEPRSIEPLKLNYAQGIWYIAAWCRSREDFRTFRMDRCDAIRLTGYRYKARTQSEARRGERGFEVVLEFSSDSWRWVSEKQHWSYVGSEMSETEASAIRAYYVCGGADDILQWILSWGPSLRVIGPESLRAVLRETLESMKNMLT